MKNSIFKIVVTMIIIFIIPTIAKTFEIYLLGHLPSTHQYSIASQYEYIKLLFDSLKAGLITPIFFIINEKVKENSDIRLKTKTIVSTFLSITGVYVILTILVFLFSPLLIKFMNVSPDLLATTKQYIHLEIIGKIFNIIYLGIFINILFLYEEYALMFISSIVYSIMKLIVDLLLIHNPFFFSFNLGVVGIGWSNIITYAVMSLFLGYFLFKKVEVFKYFNFKSKDDYFIWMKSYRVNLWCLFSEIIANGTYAYLVIKQLHEIGGLSTYWLSTRFIWGWLMIPVTAVTLYIRRDTSINNTLDKSTIIKYIKAYLMILAIWLISSPFWKFFILHIMGVKPEMINGVIHTLWLLVIPYFIYILYLVLSQILYGIGKTYEILKISIFSDLIFGYIVYAIFKYGIVSLSLENIIYFRLYPSYIVLVLATIFVLYRMNKRAKI